MPSHPHPPLGGWDVRPRRQSAHEIGTADDTDDTAVTDHWHTLYAVCRQEPRNLFEVGLLTDRDYRCRHHVACSWIVEACKKFWVHGFAFGKNRQPPILSRFPLGLAAAGEVALADHADRCPAAVDHRYGGTPAFRQGPEFLRNLDGLEVNR